MATNAPAQSPPAVIDKLHDIRPPVEISNPWIWLWIGLGVVAAAALALLLWSLWRRQRRHVLVVPMVPAHVRAKEKLQQALGLIGEPKPFCVLVSDTLRQYLEERFEFHAPERTTEEFLHELQATDRLSPEQKESLGEFLRRCDLVKFARYEPREPELRDLHAAALQLVEETEPQPEPAAVPGNHADDPHPQPVTSR